MHVFLGQFRWRIGYSSRFQLSRQHLCTFSLANSHGGSCIRNLLHHHHIIVVIACFLKPTPIEIPVFLHLFGLREGILLSTQHGNERPLLYGFHWTRLVVQPDILEHPGWTSTHAKDAVRNNRTNDVETQPERQPRLHSRRTVLHELSRNVEHAISESVFFKSI